MPAAVYGEATNYTQVHTRRVRLVRRTYGAQVEAERHSHFMLKRAFSGLDRR